MNVNLEYSNETGLPSVTQILSPLISGKRFAFTEEHANRGRLVHAACEEVVRGDLISDDLDKQLAPYMGYVHSLMQLPFLDDITLYESEKRMSDNEAGFTGQVDCICTIANTDFRGYGLIDWKTSKAKYPWWEIQLAAYAHLCELNGYKINWTTTVRIRENGRAPLINTYSGFRNIYNDKFLEALKLFKFWADWGC